MEMKEILLALFIAFSGALLDEINSPTAESYNYDTAKLERSYTSNSRKLENDLTDAIKALGIVEWEDDDFSSFANEEKSGAITVYRIQKFLLNNKNDENIIGRDKYNQEISIKHLKHEMLN